MQGFCRKFFNHRLMTLKLTINDIEDTIEESRNLEEMIIDDIEDTIE